ncbi:MAG: protein-arginine kinase [Planctomycetaceae bacterium]|nr:MAG: protein-arginine kinase [Planctomycetaceae bacterium]
MELDTLAQGLGEWLRGTGPESDVVVSSRIRLARNLARYPFPSRCSDSTRAEIEALLHEQIERLKPSHPLHYFRIDQLDPMSRQLLVERQLISRELADQTGPRGAGMALNESFSIMVNEEDHLRLQVLRSGFNLDACWQEINQLDDEIEAQVSYAFDEQFGYLTACPTNVGTGIRASVLLHLPALSLLNEEFKRVYQALQKINLAVRGMYGEGSGAMGNYYQISNQTTLGESELAIINRLKDVIPNILTYERQARKELLKQQRQELHDRVSRALGNLERAQTISSEETIDLLSQVRLGVLLDLIDDIDLQTINRLLLQTQPAHLVKLHREPLEISERNVLRATFIHRVLAEVSGTSGR